MVPGLENSYISLILEISYHYYFKCYFTSFSIVFLSGMLIGGMLNCIFILLTFYNHLQIMYLWIMSSDLSFRLLIFSVAVSNLLLISVIEFLILVTKIFISKCFVLFPVYFAFFIVSNSFLCFQFFKSIIILNTINRIIFNLIF